MKFLTTLRRWSDTSANKLHALLSTLSQNIGTLLSPFFARSTFWHRINRVLSPTVLFVCLCVLSTLSQIDVLSAFAPVRYCVLLVWFFTFLIFCIKSRMRLSGNTLKYLLPVLAFDVVIGICSLATQNLSYLTSPITYSVNLSAFVLVIGGMVGSVAEEKLLLTGARIYILCAVILSVYTICTSFVGVWFSSDVYVYARKNSLAPIIATASAMVMFLKPFRHLSISTLCMCLFIFFVMLLRTRASLLGLMLLYGVWFLFSLQGKKKKCIVGAISVTVTVLIFVVQPLHAFFIDNILLNNRAEYGIDAVTSGRSSQLSEVFTDEPANNNAEAAVTENTNETSSVTTAREETLKNTAASHKVVAFFIGSGATYIESLPFAVFISFGLLGFVPLFLFVFAPFRIAEGLRKRRLLPKYTLFLSALFVAFCVNILLEERAPFGPGVTYFFYWFTAGFCLAKTEQ